MPHPVNTSPHTSLPLTRDPGAERMPTPDRTFRETLEASRDRTASDVPAPGVSERPVPSVWEPVRAAGRRLAHSQHAIDRALSAAQGGRAFSHEELIALQAGVYRYSQELQLASKLVDGASRAIRRTLRSQR